MTELLSPDWDVTCIRVCLMKPTISSYEIGVWYYENIFGTYDAFKKIEGQESYLMYKQRKGGIDRFLMKTGSGDWVVSPEYVTYNHKNSEI